MRLKDLGYLYSGLTGKSGEDFNVEDSTQGKPFVPFTNIFNNFRVKVDDVRFVAMAKGEVQNRVKTGDILFLMSSEDYESIGKPSVVTDHVDELYLNSFCRGLRVTNKEVYSDYVAYYLSAESVRQVLRLEARGFTRINLKIDRLSSQEVQLPPLSTQRRIVAYLDEKTAAIDSRVAVLEQKLAAYKRLKASVINRAVTRGLDPKAKLKDSGVDWIGQIPEGWAVKRVKDLVKCLDGRRVPVDSALREEGIYPYWGAGSIQGYVKDYLFDEEIVLLGEDGAPFFDKDRPVSFLVKEKVWVNNHIHVLRALRIESRFLVYCLNTVDYTNFVTGAIIQKLTQEKMNRIQIPFPPLVEQRAIADYLDAECAKIDKMAELVTREIELYKKLKRSLINEVVTGKRAVA